VAPGDHPRRRRTLAAAAAAGPLIGTLTTIAVGHGSRFNDFHDYWLAGNLVAGGETPYDIGAITALAARESTPYLVGGGYSYPPPFALLMVPLAGLPFGAALAVFEAASILAFGLAVAGWLGAFLPAVDDRRGLVLAVAAGLYPPLIGSAMIGQANLLIVALTAAGVALVVREKAGARGGLPAARSIMGGAAVGLAAVVKLVPGVAVVPLGLGGRWRGFSGLLVGSVAALGLTAVISPNAFTGSGALASLFAPDAYWTNSSINGFVSRLVGSSDRLFAIVPSAFDPRLPTLILTGALAFATLAVLIEVRNCLRTAVGLAVGIGFAIVAATIGAPKTSFWNESLVLISVGLLLVAQGGADGPPLDRVDRRLLIGWLLGTILQPLAWIQPLSPDGGRGASILSTLANLLGSASLFGLIALWWFFARRLVMLRRSGVDYVEANP
jgi:alpha-1,2-mannosyltransferase